MKKLQTLLFLLLSVVLFSLQTFGQEKRDLLTDKYSRKFLAESLQRDHQWMDYPDYKDREGWEQLPENLRKNTIREGEKYLGFDWPILKATMYLEFTRTGDRTKDAEVNQ